MDDKAVSKAIVAQTLANKIIDLSREEKESLRKEIMKDVHMKYLIDAIIHASGKQNEEVGIIE